MNEAGNDSRPRVAYPVIGGYIATLCLAAAYVAIGLFVSARTDNQLVSLIVTALICGVF